MKLVVASKSVLVCLCGRCLAAISDNTPCMRYSSVSAMITLQRLSVRPCNMELLTVSKYKSGGSSTSAVDGMRRSGNPWRLKSALTDRNSGPRMGLRLKISPLPERKLVRYRQYSGKGLRSAVLRALAVAHRAPHRAQLQHLHR